MKIPLLVLKGQHETIQEEIMRAVTEVIQSQNFILGPAVRKLEERIARYCQTEFAVGVSSGTDALLISLMALGIGPGDEVITTPFTFFSTVGSIVRVGAKPVFVDIDPRSFNLNPSQIEQAISSKTKAIIVVHLFGQCADMNPILSAAEKHNLKVIEDAAQAIGAEYPDGRRAGSLGMVGCLSFFPTKNLGAFGDAGMVVTQDPRLSEILRALRVQGGSPKYYYQWVGGNFRLDTLQAAILDVKLNYLDQWIAQRREKAGRYRALFRNLNLDAIELPAELYEGTPHGHTYHQFVIRVSNRDRLREHLKQKGIDTEVYYPLPHHLQDCFRFLNYRKGDFPEAERAAAQVLALPIYPEMNHEQQEMIVEAIGKFYGR